ncbi:MAG: thiamine pyrophosphate-binding protein [Chloroflexi bacterium]|nr:thiamine pyrophosphate-binding protein [Chloroflexota bacterium]
MKTDAVFASDLIVDLLKSLGIEYIAFNPGTTFKGLHESLVNYSDGRPEMVLCLHEEVAVALAHGYGVTTGKPMAVAVHALVGLQHATMAVYNAWCDKAPVLLFGGAAALDAVARLNRPEWLHSAVVPGNLVRDFVKWDDYVVGWESLPDSILRAYRRAVEQPQGPVYVCLDQLMQEARLDGKGEFHDIAAMSKPGTLHADPDLLRQAASLLIQAEMPVIVADQMGRNQAAVSSLVQLADLLAAPVVDLGRRFNFPNNHPLDLKGVSRELIAQADVILALDVEDLWNQLHTMDRKTREVISLTKPGCRVIDISLRDLATRGWVQDYQRLQVSDVAVMADTAAAVPQLLGLCREKASRTSLTASDRRRWGKEQHEALKVRWRQEAEGLSREKPVAMAWLLHEIWPAIKDEDWVLTSGHSALAEWARRLWVMDRPYQLVPAGGIGLGRGVGVATGAALACRKNGRLVIDLQPDGDLLYAPQAIWTAAGSRLPLVVIVYNNRCYGNSEYFLAQTARFRGRTEETRGTGTYLDNPPVDFVSLARSLGAFAEGPVTEPQDITPAVRRAVEKAKRNSMPAVVEVLCRRTDSRQNV